jgi:DNA topoisomerase-2
MNELKTTTQQPNQTNKSKYLKLDAISHCHKRPDMYIGTNRSQVNQEFLYSDEGVIEFQESVITNDGIVRLFIEVLSNACDNYFRSKHTTTPMTNIRVTFDDSTNEITLMNDGLWVPVEMHEKEQIYIPEMIFGHLLSSSNYNDDEDRVTSGRNGMGVKLVNVYSKSFEIECFDYEKSVVYKQKWSNNMRKCGKARILEKKNAQTKFKSGYTKLSYVIDFTKFKDENNNYFSDEDTKYNEQTINCIRKYLVDTSMILDGIPVYFNREKLQTKKGLIDYTKLFSFVSKKDKKEWFEGSFGSQDEIQFCIVPSCRKNTLSSISFVNGIYTKDGGLHIDIFLQKLFVCLGPKLKRYNLNLKDFKNYLTVFMKVSVKNPSFSSQSKTKLVGCKDNLQKLISFDKEMSEKVASKLMKWSFINDIKETHELKQELSLKSQEKKRGYRSISNYDKANNAGTKKAQECTLILTEGLSAKTFAVKAIQYGYDGKKGRSSFGIYPLKGKLLNTKNASSAQIAANKELTDIIQILNLKHNVDYTKESNFKSLSYGKVLILADSDVDGRHIASLIILFFHRLFPSLLYRDDSFLKLCMTPIAKLKLRGNETLTFYSDYHYQKKLQEIEASNEKIQSVKYFKGLGTSTDKDIRSFADRIVNLVYNGQESDLSLDIAFNKAKTNERKDWMLDFDRENYIDVDEENNYTIPRFFNQELILFSLDDTHRSIGSILDGLKPSQRKILYCAFKKNLKYDSESQIKVAQLSGFVSEQTNYHHGEECLNQSIIKMAQNFVNSNNIALLQNVGQFGSRSMAGKDAASPRYIFTKLGTLTSTIFSSLDNPLLKHAYDDGMKVEYEHYIPIVPTVLINGMTAIGTGWSSNIPTFNLLDIIHKLKLLLVNDLEEFELCQLKPYYHGFKGTIRSSDTTNKFVSEGTFEVKELKNNKIVHVITEIPVDMTIDGYKSFLESKLEQKLIKDLKNNSSANEPYFEFVCLKDFDPVDFKLSSTISLTNMVLFNSKGKIEKYKSVDDIIYEFFDIRLEYYEKRITYMLENMNSNLQILQNKARFIENIVDNTISLMELKDDHNVSEILTERNFMLVNNSFDYLLSMQIRTMTSEKFIQLKKEINNLEKEIEILENKHVKDIWREELDALEVLYRKYYTTTTTTTTN